jgi:hypothetical protein
MEATSTIPIAVSACVPCCRAADDADQERPRRESTMQVGHAVHRGFLADGGGQASTAATPMPPNAAWLMPWPMKARR